MSDTPLTDAVSDKAKGNGFFPRYADMESHARKMERELNFALDLYSARRLCTGVTPFELKFLAKHGRVK
jgi:hypothetical protein